MPIVWGQRISTGGQRSAVSTKKSDPRGGAYDSAKPGAGGKKPAEPPPSLAPPPPKPPPQDRYMGPYYPPGGGGAAPTPDPDAELAEQRAREDAFAYLTGILQDYGLEELAQFAWNLIVQGHGTTYILQAIRDTDAFKRRFPAISERAKRGLAPISPAEYIDFERKARQLFRAEGLPPGFYDEQNDFTAFLVEDVSVVELQARIQNGFAKVALAPREIREAFRDFFGPMGDSALAAYFLDPNRAVPVLERQVASATIGGVGRRFGFNLDVERASTLAGMGIDAGGAQAGFGRVARMSPLFGETISEREDLTAEREGLDAVFDLGGAGYERIRKRLESRVAAFQGGGGALTTGQGVRGLGSASVY